MNRVLYGQEAVDAAMANHAQYDTVSYRACAARIFDERRLVPSTKWHDGNQLRKCAGGDHNKHPCSGPDSGCYAGVAHILEAAHARGIGVRVVRDGDYLDMELQAGIPPEDWACEEPVIRRFGYKGASLAKYRRDVVAGGYL